MLGLYIAVFFVVSQVVSVAMFGERPSLALLAGGALIIVGGMFVAKAMAGTNMKIIYLLIF